MTKKILVTGGTVFVSKFVATYFKNHDYDVYVLNRGNRKQILMWFLMLLLILNKMSKIC